MARMVTIKCPGCGHTWREDYDQWQAMRVVYKGDPKKTKIEEYHFTCPIDGTQFVKTFAVTDDNVEEE